MIHCWLPFGKDPSPHHNNDTTFLPRPKTHTHTHTSATQQTAIQRHISTELDTSPSPAQVFAHFISSGMRSALEKTRPPCGASFSPNNERVKVHALWHEGRREKEIHTRREIDMRRERDMREIDVRRETRKCNSVTVVIFCGHFVFQRMKSVRICSVKFFFSQEVFF